MKAAAFSPYRKLTALIVLSVLMAHISILGKSDCTEEYSTADPASCHANSRHDPSSESRGCGLCQCDIAEGTYEPVFTRPVRDDPGYAAVNIPGRSIPDFAHPQDIFVPPPFGRMQADLPSFTTREWATIRLML